MYLIHTINRRFYEFLLNEEITENKVVDTEKCNDKNVIKTHSMAFCQVTIIALLVKFQPDKV